MNCPSCGNEAFEGAEICFDCGEPLIAGAAPGKKVEPVPGPVPVPARPNVPANVNVNGNDPAPGSFRATAPSPAPVARRKWRTDDANPIRCPGCGAKNSPELARCRNCGDPIRPRD